MKLTAMSRAYVTRTISKKAEARKAEILGAEKHTVGGATC